MQTSKNAGQQICNNIGYVYDGSGLFDFSQGVVANDQSFYCFNCLFFWNIFFLYFSLFLTKFYLFLFTPGLEYSISLVRTETLVAEKHL